MNTLLVVFDPNSMSQEAQEQVVNYLKNAGSWAKLSPNAWLVKVGRNSVEFRDELRSHSEGGKLVVLNVTGDGWGTSFSNEVSKWMKENI